MTFLVVWVMIIGIIIYIFQYRKRRLLNLQEQEKMKREHQSELLTTQLEIQNQTMQHIGREIHDNVGQKLTLASIYIQQLAYENKAPHIFDQIETISSIINSSLSELRQLSKSLTDDSIANKSLDALLKEECGKITGLKKYDILYSNSQSSISLPYQVKSILLRIVQEFLQNSIKHSDCKNMQISLDVYETLLHLHLEDDGKGFETNGPMAAGIGLANMKKRAQMIGGSYHLQSISGKGTELDVRIPLNQIL